MVRCSLMPACRALAVACCFPAMAAGLDSGKIAVAQIVPNIKIDGDLSEWPTSAVRWPVAHHVDGPPVPAEDFHARFGVAYDPDASLLFVAVQVRDEHHRVDEPGRDLSDQDGCLIYLNSKHDPRGSGVIGYVASGEGSGVTKTRSSWDPEVATKLVTPPFEHAVEHHGSQTTYEFSFDVPAERLRSGRTLGLEVTVIDLDQGSEATWWSWGPMHGASLRAGRCGDVFLADSQTRFGVVEGRRQWSEATLHAPDGPRRLRIQSLEDPECWFFTRLKDDGSFRVEVPVGPYEIACPPRIWQDDDRPTVVLAGAPSVRCEALPDKTTQAPTLTLEAEPLPDRFPEPGFLFDYGPEDTPRLEAFVEEYQRYYRVPGLCIALIQDAQLVYHGTFGVQNLYTQEPVDDTTIFEAASITKIVFAFAVHRMVERGELNLDQPLHELLPFPEIAHDERFERITARHILTHQSGFPNWRWQNPHGKMDIAFEPGTDFRYSGEGMEYLGRVISKIAGKSIEQILHEETLDPLGLSNVYFRASPALSRVVSHGHSIDRSFNADPPTEVGVAHSMHTNAKSLADFMIALMGREGLDFDTYDAMLTKVVDTPPSTNEHAPDWTRGYGLGFAVADSPHGLVYGHGGANGDFHCLFEAYDDYDAGFLVFTNGEHGRSFCFALRRFLVMGRGEGASSPR